MVNQELARQEEYWDNTLEDFDSIYSHRKTRFDNWIDATFRWDMYARFEYTMKQSEPVQGRSFLDVGCGTGQYSLEYARRGAARVVGIDIADRMIAACEARAKRANLENCCFVKSDLLAYLPESKFDVVIGIGLFDYIRDAQPVITKMREVVTDRAILSLPRLWTWRAPVRKVRLAFKGCAVFFYTEGQVKRMLELAGFSRHEMQVVGQLYCVTAYV